MTKPRKSFAVRVLQETPDIYEGSVIQVDRILKKHYSGIWSSMFGSYRRKVLKSNAMRL